MILLPTKLASYNKLFVLSLFSIEIAVLKPTVKKPLPFPSLPPNVTTQNHPFIYYKYPLILFVQVTHPPSNAPPLQEAINTNQYTMQSFASRCIHTSILFEVYIPPHIFVLQQPTPQHNTPSNIPPPYYRLPDKDILRFLYSVRVVLLKITNSALHTNTQRVASTKNASLMFDDVLDAALKYTFPPTPLPSKEEMLPASCYD